MRGLNRRARKLVRELLRPVPCGCGRQISSTTQPAAKREGPVHKSHGEGPDLAHFLKSVSDARLDVGCGSAGTPAGVPSLPSTSVERLQTMVQQLTQATPDGTWAPASRPQPILTDSHGRFHNYLRISLTERCNLRCVYCMPEEGVELQPSERLLTTAEVVRLAALFAGQGVDKVRLTGGEPLIRRDLPEVVEAIAALPGMRQVGVTTNGISLKRKLPALRDAGLTHINVSLDTLSPERFTQITRRKGLDHVLKGLDAALELGFGGRLKINCVVMAGVNDHEIASFLKFCESSPIDVRFIEWMPFGGNRWKDSKFVSYKAMLGRISAEYPGLHPVRASRNDTTKWWQVPGHQGRVGFITSMSEHFCGTCNRLRITADGSLKVCLFGDESLSLRDALRGGMTDEEVGVLVRAAVRSKKEALGGHGDMYGIAQSDNRPMITIGG